MGTFLNPGNSAFAAIVKDGYTDKTGLVALINSRIDTPRRLVCVSRPRRFGKSFAAQMLCAYYDRTCRSEELFSGLAAAADADFGRHLNAYDVIYVDMTYLTPYTDNYRDIAGYLTRRLTERSPRLIRRSKPAASWLKLCWTRLSGTAAAHHDHRRMGCTHPRKRSHPADLPAVPPESFQEQRDDLAHFCVRVYDRHPADQERRVTVSHFRF